MLLSKLIEHEVRLYPDSEVVEITGNGVLAVSGGSLLFLKADTVILAVGATPEKRLVDKLHSLVSEVYAIGDCAEPKDAAAAIKQAAEVGRRV